MNLSYSTNDNDDDNYEDNVYTTGDDEDFGVYRTSFGNPCQGPMLPRSTFTQMSKKGKDSWKDMSASDRQAIFDGLSGSDSGSQGSPAKSNSSGDSSGFQKISRNLNQGNNSNNRSVRFTESYDEGVYGNDTFGDDTEYIDTSDSGHKEEGELEANYATASRFGSMDINKTFGSMSIAKSASDIRDMMRSEA